MFSKIHVQQSSSTCNCSRKSDFLAVRPNLAVTPAQMLELAKGGIPVSGPNVHNFFDGVANPSFDVPLDRQRGVDIADMWTARYETNGKLVRYHKSSKFVDTNQTE